MCIKLLCCSTETYLRNNVQTKKTGQNIYVSSTSQIGPIPTKYVLFLLCTREWDRRGHLGLDHVVAHVKVCANQNTLDLYWSVKIKNDQTIISAFDMVHMVSNAVVSPIHKEPFCDMEQTSKNMFSLGWIVRDLTHFAVDGEGPWGLPHIKFPIPVMDILCKDHPHSIHELI